jgi:hypothetical protein
MAKNVISVGAWDDVSYILLPGHPGDNLVVEVGSEREFAMDETVFLA